MTEREYNRIKARHWFEANREYANAKRRESYQARREAIRAALRERYATDPEYRQRVLEVNRRSYERRK